MKAGADEFLMKPCNPADLLAAIERACGWKAAPPKGS
jgi:FixJ family two-component response regulator